MKKRTLFFVVLLVVALWALTLWGGHTFFDSWPTRGQFGDLFGSVNALFSGLAFAGLVYVILLQREDLALQREELRLQRKEMAASRKQLAAQAKAQVDLFRATVGQIRVAAEQARIEAVKLRPTASATQQDKRADGIEKIAQTVEGFADALESDEGGGQPLAEVGPANDLIDYSSE